MKCFTMISVSDHVAFTSGLRSAAQITALATISSGEIFTPSMRGDCLSRLTNSMVRVASTSTKMDTWGAVNADLTMFWAVALRTPLTLIRSTRSPLSRTATGVALPEAAPEAPLRSAWASRSRLVT